MNCSSCGASAAAAAEFCPGCLAELPRAVAAAPAPQSPPLPEEFAGARCPQHPDFPALGTCDRCGRFCCVRCLPEVSVHESRTTCPECVAAIAALEAPGRAKAVRRQIVGSFVLLGIIPLVVFGELGRHAPHLESVLVGVYFGSFFALPLFACAVALALTKRRWVAWIAVGFEVLFAMLALFFESYGLFTLVLLLLPMVTAARIQKLSELERGAAELPSSGSPRAPAA